MKQDLKDDLINKLLNQQTIIINSSSEVDFRRAEITYQLIKTIVDVNNIESDPVIFQSGTDWDKLIEKIQEAGIKPTDPLFVSNREKHAILGEQKKPKKEKVKRTSTGDRIQEIHDILQEQDRPLRIKELSHIMGFGDKTNLNAFINNNKTKLNIVYFRGNHKSDLLFLANPEWLDEKKLLKQEYIDKLVAVRPKSKFTRDIVEQREPTHHNTPLSQKIKKTTEKINKGSGQTFKVDSQNPELRKSIDLGDDVKFFDVLRNQVIGKIISLNPAFKSTPKGDRFEEKTVTIKHEGNMYDRPLNQILKYE